MRRNEQTRCSLGPTIAQQDRAMARLLKAARRKVAAMSPEELKAMHEAQAQSWARQDLD